MRTERSSPTRLFRVVSLLNMRVFTLISILLVAASFASAQTLAKVQDELLGHLKKLEKASNYGGSSDYEVLGKENDSLRAALIKYGSRTDVLTYAFPRLKKLMDLTTSRDGKLRTYSWDSNEGGTMHDYRTVYQFRGKSGKASASADAYTQSLEDRDAGAFVHQIFQTDTPTGPIYLAVSTFIGSTSISGATISTVTIDGERLNRSPKLIRTAKGVTDSISFQYDFFSVVDRPERPIRLFTYDETKKSFRFPIVIEDRRTPLGRVTNRFITYRFDGKYFVKVV
ncbi:hypothetical protein BH10ACI2_BH10ACI2_21200 [soil metagenome]